MFAKYRAIWFPFVRASTELVVHRLPDGENASFYALDGKDLGHNWGFFWVKNQRRFLEAAATPLTITPCQDPGAWFFGSGW